MSRSLATARRVLQQLSHDRRSVALIVLLPSLLLALFKGVFQEDPAAFDRIGPQMLGIFPFTIMFLVTSVTMVRERTSGTLERLLTTPLRRRELVLGYGLAFGLAGLVQALVSSAVAVWGLGLDVRSPWVLVLLAVVDGLLGTALGLLMSAFAVTEFQAVQFMPLVVIPQLLLCGLLTPRDQMAVVLDRASDLLPPSYAAEAFSAATRTSGLGGDIGRDLLVLVFCVWAAISGAAVTLRRRTP